MDVPGVQQPELRLPNRLQPVQCGQEHGAGDLRCRPPAARVWRGAVHGTAACLRRQHAGTADRGELGVRVVQQLEFPAADAVQPMQAGQGDGSGYGGQYWRQGAGAAGRFPPPRKRTPRRVGLPILQQSELRLPHSLQPVQARQARQRGAARGARKQPGSASAPTRCAPDQRRVDRVHRPRGTPVLPQQCYGRDHVERAAGVCASGRHSAIRSVLGGGQEEVWRVTPAVPPCSCQALRGRRV
mmetsp:Transcript_32298/g.77440  ORF Transcript_32298/g.77440 Transcript_32298/m.77440 type:complete len:242 (+) Transcript_32298:776-1501(+)